MMDCAKDRTHWKGRCLKIGVLMVLGIAALGGVVMGLWNALIPELFPGAQPLAYFQALGLLLLSRILFGGFRGGHGRWREHRQHWESLSAEERAELKTRFKSRWGNCCGSRESSSETARDSSAPSA